jgi:hypothetical protein
MRWTRIGRGCRCSSCAGGSFRLPGGSSAMPEGGSEFSSFHADHFYRHFKAIDAFRTARRCFPQGQCGMRAESPTPITLQSKTRLRWQSHAQISVPYCSNHTLRVPDRTHTALPHGFLSPRGLPPQAEFPSCAKQNCNLSFFIVYFVIEYLLPLYPLLLRRNFLL